MKHCFEGVGMDGTEITQEERKGEKRAVKTQKLEKISTEFSDGGVDQKKKTWIEVNAALYSASKLKNKTVTEQVIAMLNDTLNTRSLAISCFHL